MPGRSPESQRWGDLPLVVDTSAWARAHLPAVRATWQAALVGDQLRLSPIARLEFLLVARDGASFDGVSEELDAWRTTPLSPSVLRAGQHAMRQLAHGSAGSHRLPVVDYLLAASAQEIGGAVLHYDRDYDTLAEVMNFESVWIAPAGALP